jgi:hypothetical protein
VCDHMSGKVSYVKAHVDGRHRFSLYGNVGH